MFITGVQNVNFAPNKKKFHFSFFLPAFIMDAAESLYAFTVVISEPGVHSTLAFYFKDMLFVMDIEEMNS